MKNEIFKEEDRHENQLFTTETYLVICSLNCAFDITFAIEHIVKL